MSDVTSKAPGENSGQSSRQVETSRRPDIQGLRAIAVLAVIAFHAGLPLPGGFAGVDVFFVISGFVITLMLGKEFALTNGIRFRHFYARRFRRLTPALALTVTVTIAISVLVLSPLGPMQTGAETGIGAMLLSANFVIAHTTGGYFDAPASINPLLNTWSLSVEEQFYLVFPIVLLTGWLISAKTRRLRFAPIAIVISVSALSLLVALITSLGGVVPHFPTVLTGFYSTALRAWEFGLGAAIALLLPHMARIPSRVASLLGMVGAAGLLLSFLILHETSSYPGIPTLLPTISTAALLIGGTSPFSVTSRALSTRPMVKIGDTSYSLYLWHWPIIVLAVLAWPDSAWIPLIAVLVSIVPALISFHWLESPIRELRNVSLQRMLVIVAATLITPIAVCAGVLVAAQNGFWNATVQNFQISLAPHVGEMHDCITKLPVDQRDLAACTWNEAASGRPIYLVGDSNAEHFSEAAIAASESLDRPLTIVTSPSCPLIDAYFAGVNQEEFSWCRDYLTSAVTWLESRPPGTVIWASADEYWWDPAISAGQAPDDTSTSEKSKSVALRAGLERVVQALKARGDAVVLVPSVPHFRYPEPLWDSSHCSLPTLLGQRCARTLPRELISSRQATARADIDAVARATSSLILELDNFFCDKVSCSTSSDDRTQYRDWSHISVQMSESLHVSFAKSIREADAQISQ